MAAKRRQLETLDALRKSTIKCAVMMGLNPSVKTRRGGDNTFFVTLLESQDFSLFVTGAAQPKLTMENLGRFKLAVPPVAEQKEIAAFIREKDVEFRPLLAQIERQIETLIAYRKSLIHECVTGQRRITAAEVRDIIDRAAKLTGTGQREETHA